MISANALKNEQKSCLKLSIKVFKIVTKFKTVVGCACTAAACWWNFEVLHGQSQFPYLSQSGSAKGSSNKVILAHDISSHTYLLFYINNQLFGLSKSWQYQFDLNTLSHKSPNVKPCFLDGVFLLYIMNVVHSRDHQEVDMAHDLKSPENQLQMTMGQYWLGKKLSTNKLSECF